MARLGALAELDLDHLDLRIAGILGEALRIEAAIVRPKLFVALGATAAQSLTGSGRDILKRRGRFEETRDGRPILITIHPSALLRIPNARDAAAARQRFREDLGLVLAKLPGIAVKS